MKNWNAKKILIYLVPLIVVAGAYYFIASFFSYIDIVSGCKIGIYHDIIRGNRNTIIEAIKQVKSRNKDAYHILCNSVDQISENYCVGSDWNIDSSRRGENADGCFIKGSKVIYLRPSLVESSAMVDRRADALEKYSLMSQNYWWAK